MTPTCLVYTTINIDVVLVLTPASVADASAVHIPFLGQRGGQSPETVILYVNVMVARIILGHHTDIVIRILPRVGIFSSAIVAIHRIGKSHYCMIGITLNSVSKEVVISGVAQEAAVACIPSVACRIVMSSSIVIWQGVDIRRQFRAGRSEALVAFNTVNGVVDLHAEEALQLAVFHLVASDAVTHPQP